ncbi:MAG: FxsA family protein, partial [Pirellulaceae bacterium]|nr:FxsA family protein [Pirellulaceae bacterium]
MFARLLLLFILLPLSDLVLIWMLLKLDVGLTVLWIVVSGLIGAWYVRRQGIQVMDELRKTLAENQL